MKTTISLNKVKEELHKAGVHFDTLSVRKGIITGRREFFYTNGLSERYFVDGVSMAFPNATITDSGEVWKPFRGGAETRNSSHWFVKFAFEPNEKQLEDARDIQIEMRKGAKP